MFNKFKLRSEIHPIVLTSKVHHEIVLAGLWRDVTKVDIGVGWVSAVHSVHVHVQVRLILYKIQSIFKG